MADAVVQFVARLKSTTGLASDICENVFHALVDDATFTTDLAAAMQEVANFYTVDTGAGMLRAVGAYLSGDLTRAANGCEVLAYFTDDLTGATPFGSPVGSLTFTLPAAFDANQLPEEVAVVVSTHADLTGVPLSEPNPTPPPATIRPQQRRRGRTFIGPLAQGAGASVSGHYRPTSQFRSDVAVSYQSLIAELALLVDYQLAIWSKADAAVYPIQGGYIDDAWDTQRRRGLEATSRLVWT